MRTSDECFIKYKPKYIYKFLDGLINDSEAINEFSQIEVQNNQYNMSEISMFIDDQLISRIKLSISNMYEKNIYNNDSLIHSTKHIENVITFAAIIGKSIGLNSHEMDLLLEAAKYHDAGRINDNNENHADKGSLIAIEMLKNEYSMEDINIIATAIAYHEDFDNQNIFLSKCQTHGIDKTNYDVLNLTFKISNCLKDADALDRTRFICTSNAFLKESMLRYEFSKKLIKIAEQINETYAIDDILKISENDQELKKIFKDELNKLHNPKLVVRNFRHGYIKYNGKINNLNLNQNKYTDEELKTIEKCAKINEIFSSKLSK